MCRALRIISARVQMQKVNMEILKRILAKEFWHVRVSKDSSCGLDEMWLKVKGGLGWGTCLEHFSYVRVALTSLRV